MEKQLKVLIVGGSKEDALLIVDELQQTGHAVAYTWANTMETYRRDLDAALWDIILCDYALPAMDALKVLQQRALDIPFIIVSNMQSKELALACLRAGASDYLLRDNLFKLAVTVEKEIRNARIRVARKQADAEMTSLLKSLKDVKSALDQSSIVCITDSTGAITYVNDKFCLISQFKSEELLGKDHRLINSGHHAPAFFQQMWETIRTGSVWRGEIRNKAKDGSFFWVDTVITPFLDGEHKPVQYFAISSEITQRKLYEEELIAARERAEVASKAKSVFLANTSHEIRNPMNGIIGMSNILARTELSAEQRKYLGLIQLSSDKLMGIINDILDFSKMEAGKLQIHHQLFNLVDFIEETIALNQTNAQQKGLKLISEIDFCHSRHFVGDPDRLRQILINLLQNGIKFTDSGFVKLQVSCNPLSEERCKLTFAITDTGIGIRKEDIDRLFQPFYQLDSSSTKKHEGTGLGLAIVKKLVEMMEGNIHVESEPGRGSTFRIELEMKRAHERPAPEELVTANKDDLYASEAAGVKVLIAEDNAINRMHLKLLLGDKGYVVFEATNGLEALNLYKQETFDVILMDGQMPKMDGFLAIEKIREIEKGSSRRTPIIALSGYANDSDKNKFYTAGIDEFISKPVSEYELFEKLKALIE